MKMVVSLQTDVSKQFSYRIFILLLSASLGLKHFNLNLSGHKCSLGQ